MPPRYRQHPLAARGQRRAAGDLPTLPDVSKPYRDLRIDLVRTHDFFGPADIDARWPNPDPIAKGVRADGSKSLFPRWQADPEAESSYNWGPTDSKLGAIVGCGAEVFYRIGRSWSADPSPPPTSTSMPTSSSTWPCTTTAAGRTASTIRSATGSSGTSPM